MEQKGTLWIIAAVGIFLLAVLLPAIILFKPDTRKVQPTAPVAKPSSGGWIMPPASSPSGGANQSETAKSDLPADTSNSERSPMTAESKAQSSEQNITRIGDMTVVAQNATVYGIEKSQDTKRERDGSTLIDLNELRTENAPSSDTVTPKNETSAKSMETVRQTARASSAERKEESTREIPNVSARAPSEPRSTAVKKPSSAPKTSATKSTTPKASTQKNSASSKAAQKTTASSKSKMSAGKTQYWVQAASFASKNGADSARSVLDENKIPADVFTYKDGKGKVFYRVRIGPYVTKSEAEYWRTRVAQINDFKSGESYITQTSSATD